MILGRGCYKFFNVKIEKEERRREEIIALGYSKTKPNHRKYATCSGCFEGFKVYEKEEKDSCYISTATCLAFGKKE